MRRGYSFLQLFVVAVVKPTLLLLTKRDWRGQQHIPGSGGMILAANHLSLTDPIAISHFLHESGRWPVFLAKSELFDVPVLGNLIARIGQVPVYRHSTDAGLSLRAAQRSLAEGACVIFYPEGTCTRDPELWPMVGKTGVARVALTTGVPVIPLAHWGPHDLLPYGEKKPHLFPRRVMHIAAGPPVDLAAYRDKELTAKNLRAATDEVSRAITVLLAGLRGQEAPPGPYDPRTRRYVRADSSPEVAGVEGGDRVGDVGDGDRGGETSVSKATTADDDPAGHGRGSA